MGEHQPTALPVLNDSERLGLERKSAGDFPLYRQDPHTPSARGWALILLGVILGFAALSAPIDFFKTTSGGLCARTPVPSHSSGRARHGGGNRVALTVSNADAAGLSLDAGDYRHQHTGLNRRCHGHAAPVPAECKPGQRHAGRGVQYGAHPLLSQDGAPALRRGGDLHPAFSGHPLVLSH